MSFRDLAEMVESPAAYAVAGFVAATIFRFAREVSFVLAVSFVTATALAFARQGRDNLIVRIGRTGLLVYRRPSRTPNTR